MMYAIIFFITTFGIGVLCLCGGKPREYTLEDFDEWWYSKYPEKRPREEAQQVEQREYTMEDFDEWWYSKFPEKRPSEKDRENTPREYTLEEFDYSKYLEKRPPENLDPKSRTYIDVNGYRRYSDSHRLVHVHVAEVFVVKRKLRKYEVVHHINGKKLDNRPENLKVMPWKEHQKLHGREGK